MTRVQITLAVLALLLTQGCHLTFASFEYGDAGVGPDATVDSGLDAGDAERDGGGNDAGQLDAGRPDGGPDEPAVGRISAGRAHTCALTRSDGAKCWGLNAWGQLGDGTTTNSYTPSNATGLMSGLTAIGAGGAHTCALNAFDGLRCWGWNGFGQLGDGTIEDRFTSVDVTGLTSGVAAIATGEDHTCAVTTSGGAKCWGNNSSGQLGDGTTAHSYTPVDVTGLSSGVAGIAAGVSHTCALTTSGGVKCWGNNDYGQLGNSSTTRSPTPVDVGGLTTGVAAIATGALHTCALTTSGGVMCWGWNGRGELGNGETTASSTAVAVAGLAEGVVAIAAARGSHTCALTTSGGLECWGHNVFGQLGDGTTTGSSTPIGVVGLTSGVMAVAAGNSHTCAVTTSDGIKCWGFNMAGALGDDTTTTASTPVTVVGF